MEFEFTSNKRIMMMPGRSQSIVYNHQSTPLFTMGGLIPPSPPRTRYQGSKYKLLEWIWQYLSDLDFDTVLDVFGGSACVSHFLKARGKEVTYNDILTSNYFIGQALVANDSETLTNSDISFLLRRHRNQKYSNFIKRTFHDIYFTDEENVWLDTVVQNITKLPNINKKAIAYYALFQAAISKRPYNLFHRKNLYIRTSEVIPILFIDCRLPDLVIPAKLVRSKVEGAGIQALPVSIMYNFFGNF